MNSSAQGLKRLSESGIALIVYALSITVISLVAFLIFFPNALSLGKFDVSYAPVLHAFINGMCSILLSAGYVAIRKRRIRLHKTLMVSAFTLSSVFLISYVIYHSQQQEPVHFGAQGMIRSVYFFILVTHIVLAAGILPLALFTIIRAWRDEFTKHRRIARITLPLWLYVTLTGVLVYLMLYVWYPS